MDKNKKKKKLTSTDRPAKEKEAFSEAPATAVSTGPLVGIIGWNSPRFMESHSGFIEGIKASVASHGARPVFVGVSGSADVSHFPSRNGHGHSKSAMEGMGALSAIHYSLPSRDIVADQIELLIQEEHIEGLVLIPWSINSMVGMMMASARCGVPTLFLPHYSSWTDLLAPGQNEEPTYSQWSMLLLLEAMGLAKLGTLDHALRKEKISPPKTGSQAESYENVAWGGQRIADMARQKISQKRFFSQASFSNALCVDMAMGASTESVLHLTAVAYEAGIPLPLTAFNDASGKIPQLAPLGKEGEITLEEFTKMGGLQALLAALSHSLQASPTVVGKNIIEIAKEMSLSKSPFRMDHPVKKQRGLSILLGNLAREGAIFRVSGIKDNMLSGMAPCHVFNSESACADAINNKKIKKGEVIVLRYCGPRGSPGMPHLGTLREALVKRDLDDSVLIITDGRLNLPGCIASIVHVSPEAATGSALSIIQDKDVVSWNFNEKLLTVRLTETEIKVRLSRWKEQDKNMKNTFLYRYSKYSSSSSYGAKLV